MDDFLARPYTQLGDEFEIYCKQAPTVINPKQQFSPVKWWWNNQGTFPTLFQDALDKLAISAMFVECERVFSSVKKMITPERNSLLDDIVEACECLKAWWDNKMIVG
jgi:hypothetical protein